MISKFIAKRNKDSDGPRTSLNTSGVRAGKASSTSSSRAPPSTTGPAPKRVKTLNGATASGPGKVGGKIKGGGGRTRADPAAGNKRKAASEDEPEEEEPRYSQTHVDDINKYEDIDDWEPLVESVDTIVNNEQGHLLVYLTM
jgi:hypothetical protein